MWETLRKEEIFKKLQTDRRGGITEEKAKERQIKYGKNKLEDKKKETLLVKFIKQFNDFMIIILIIASIVSAAISTIQGENDYIDAIIIIAIVICYNFKFFSSLRISVNFFRISCPKFAFWSSHEEKYQAQERQRMD